MPSVNANGANIHYEIRGNGPPLLFICGSFADVDHFASVADKLASEFMVVTYDRRGNSRSDGLVAGTPTTADEQADDAAALLKALSLVPAAVYGNSSGAIIGLNLVIRHPQAVSAAILHEPPLGAGMSNPAAVGATIRGLTADGMAAGGPALAAERFLRWAMGDALWEQLPAATKQRARENGPAFFGSEAGHVDAYNPSNDDLRGISCPVQVFASTRSHAFFGEVTTWLGAKLGTPVTKVPGTHTPQLDHPAELAEAIRHALQGSLLGA